MTETAPATVPGSGGDTTCITRTGCPSGIEVTSCTVTEGGHTDAVWNFFKRLSR